MSQYWVAKEIDINCPKCGDVLSSRQEPSDDPDYEFYIEAGCIECCTLIQHKYPTEQYQKKVHDYLLNSNEWIEPNE